MAVSLRTPIGILSFPVLFSPKAVVPGAEPRFSLNLLFDAAAQKSTEFAALKRAVIAAIDEKWGNGKGQDKAFIARLHLPFLACKDVTYDGYDILNGVFIRPWSKNKPGIVDAQRQEITVAGDVWAGQHVRCTVNPFAYEQTGNRGISFGLNNVQVCRTDGKRLDGRRAANQDFDDYEDANALADEEIPF